MQYYEIKRKSYILYVYFTQNTPLHDLKGQAEKLSFKKNNLEQALSSHDVQLISYKFVKAILQKFHKMLDSTPNEQKKELLHLLLDKITINNNRDISSIKLHLNTNIQNHLGANEITSTTNPLPLISLIV